MKRKLVFCNDQFTLNLLSTDLEGGWILDPAYDAKPLRLDNAVIFPLVLYEDDLERAYADEQKASAEVKVGEFDGVVSLRDVPNAEVDPLLKDGYVIQAIYAKSTILLKRQAKEATP